MLSDRALGILLQEKEIMKDLIIDCFAGGGGASVYRASNEQVKNNGKENE